MLSRYRVVSQVNQMADCEIVRHGGNLAPSSGTSQRSSKRFRSSSIGSLCGISMNHSRVRLRPLWREHAMLEDAKDYAADGKI